MKLYCKICKRNTDVILSDFAGGIFVCRKCSYMSMSEIKQHMLDTTESLMYKDCVTAEDKRRILIKEDDNEMLQMSEKYKNEF